MKKKQLPKGWDDRRVKDVIAHYETQSEDAEWSEIQSYLDGEETTLIAVPNELLPQVRAILARHQTQERK